MHYDLHVHTAEYSACSVIPADDLCRLAFEQGIDGVALTEHDFWWPENELVALRARYPEWSFSTAWNARAVKVISSCFYHQAKMTGPSRPTRSMRWQHGPTPKAAC